MKNMALIGVAVLVIGGLFVFGNMARSEKDSSDTAQEGSQQTIVRASGNLLKGEPDRTKHGWRFVENGTIHELAFSSRSVCAGKTGSGICSPDHFIDGRAAEIEGEIVDGMFRVYKMTFTEAIGQ